MSTKSILTIRHTALTLLFVSLLVFVSATNTWACDCKATFSVPSSSGDITITKIKVASLKDLFGGNYLVFPYSNKWSGSQKIKSGKKHTFKFNVSSNCSEGLRRFAFKRKDGKTCYGYYPTGDDYDLCGVKTSSLNRKAPVISCNPSDWKN